MAADRERQDVYFGGLPFFGRHGSAPVNEMRVLVQQ